MSELYVSEDEFILISKTVQRLKKKQRDEKKWLNFISNDVQRNTENVFSENPPATQVIHHQKSLVEAYNNAPENLYCESAKKLEETSLGTHYTRATLGDHEMKSSSTACQDLCVEEVGSIEVARIKYCRSRISATLDDMMHVVDNMPVPEDDKDLARRTFRASEFNAMFTRNYLYQLQRNETDLKKRQNVLMSCLQPHFGHINSMHQKLTTAYHVGLQALLVYLHHIPKTITCALPGKLKNLLAYICHLEMALSNVSTQVDDTEPSDVIMSKCKNLLALINAKKQDEEICTCPANHVPRVKIKKQKKNSSKLSPYNVKSSKTTLNSKPLGYLKTKKTIIKTKEYEKTGNMKREKFPDRIVSCAVKEVPSHQEMSRNERSKSKSKRRMDVRSVNRSNFNNKGGELCMRPDELIMNERTKINIPAVKRIEKSKRLSQKDQISRKQDLCHQEEVSSPPTKKDSDAKFGVQVPSVKDVPKSNKSSNDNKIVELHEHFLLEETSPPLSVCSSTANAKDGSYFCGTVCDGRIAFSGTDAQQKDCLNFVNGQNKEISPSKRVLQDSASLQQQLSLSKSAATHTEANWLRKKTIPLLCKNNMKIPWNIVKKLCDELIQEAIHDTVKEAEDTVYNIGEEIFENEFKCLFT